MRGHMSQLRSYEFNWGHLRSNKITRGPIWSQKGCWGYTWSDMRSVKVLWVQLWAAEVPWGWLWSLEVGWRHMRFYEVTVHLFTWCYIYMRSNENGYGLKGVTWGRSAGFTCDNISSAEVTWSRMIGECCRLCCISIAAYLDIRPFW